MDQNENKGFKRKKVDNDESFDKGVAYDDDDNEENGENDEGENDG